MNPGKIQVFSFHPSKGGWGWGKYFNYRILFLGLEKFQFFFSPKVIVVGVFFLTLKTL